ncbi:MAG: hypothetical protein ACJAV1_003643 [Paraglaciecola sp.]
MHDEVIARSQTAMPMILTSHRFKVCQLWG